jgi:modulator of FtsH protease HflK
MSWNKGGNNKGPWGQPPQQGGNSGGTRPPRKPSQRPEQPDIDELLRKSQESFKAAFGGGKGGAGGAGLGGVPSKKPLIAAAAVLLALWFSSGIYRVDADEQGVVLRFGEFHRTTEPGLNYHFPYPFEMAFTPQVTTINREEIGFRTQGTKRENVPEESLMLTSDKNLVSAQFEVQWRIKDAVKFLFNIRNPDTIVKPVAETSLREVMGNTELTLALSDKRQAVAEETRQLVQNILDEYETGIEIFEVNLLAVDAPEPVVDAFIDVLAAQQEKETLQNQALKYRDGIIPVAQGQAQKMVNDALAYREAQVAKAEGEASRFQNILDEYSEAKDVTRKRMYLETMENVMQGMDKVILENDGSKQGVLPYLPLPSIEKKKGDK